MQTSAYGVVMGQSKPTKQHSGLGDHLGLLGNASHTSAMNVLSYLSSALHIIKSFHLQINSSMLSRCSTYKGTLHWELFHDLKKGSVVCYPNTGFSERRQIPRKEQEGKQKAVSCS